ncbi:MAG: DNA repair protein RadA [Oscillospiraceae bacterium]|nr:DNA repair protein RadA [Oscillospiraceae bacterium]
MAKEKTIYQCSECGAAFPKWQGKCTTCGEWNSLMEERVSAPSKHDNVLMSGNAPKKLAEIELKDDNRFSSGIGELDRVLGGGIVSGSLVLVGGDPGIGKSTLLLQMCGASSGTPGTASPTKQGAAKCVGDGVLDIPATKAILYASGEESQQQIKIRANRLGIKNDNLHLVSENNLDNIIRYATEKKPAILIVDSVQTVYKPDIPSPPGSVNQIREVTMTLMKIAKETGIVVFLVGHVTKGGELAGPKILEHMVDCVLYFEGERHQFHRILRSVKNRFGSTNEIGVFEMRDVGLVEVENPSEMLLSGRPENQAGSCVVCTMEGTRPILAEIQALVSHTSYNLPRRISNGIDNYRLSMLIAVLEKRVGLNLSGEDAYVNVIGGLRLDEPAVDLGVALAICSSFRNAPIDNRLMAIGEVGLTGEVRCVNMIEKRLNEAAKLGFTSCIIPKGNAKDARVPKGLAVIEVENVKDALKVC